MPKYQPQNPHPGKRYAACNFSLSVRRGLRVMAKFVGACPYFDGAHRAHERRDAKRAMEWIADMLSRRAPVDAAISDRRSRVTQISNAARRASIAAQLRRKAETDGVRQEFARTVPGSGD